MRRCSPVGARPRVLVRGRDGPSNVALVPRIEQQSDPAPLRTRTSMNWSRGSSRLLNQCRPAGLCASSADHQTPYYHTYSSFTRSNGVGAQPTLVAPLRKCDEHGSILNILVTIRFLCSSFSEIPFYHSLKGIVTLLFVRRCLPHDPCKNPSTQTSLSLCDRSLSHHPSKPISASVASAPHSFCMTVMSED